MTRSEAISLHAHALIMEFWRPKKRVHLVWHLSGIIREVTHATSHR